MAPGQFLGVCKMDSSGVPSPARWRTSLFSQLPPSTGIALAGPSEGEEAGIACNDPRYAKEASDQNQRRREIVRKETTPRALRSNLRFWSEIYSVAECTVPKRSSDKSMTSKTIPRLSISDSRSAACCFHSEVSRTQNLRSLPSSLSAPSTASAPRTP